MSNIIKFPGPRQPIEVLATDYLKRIWDHMAWEDGEYEAGAFVVTDGGHTVNGLFIDDVHAEMNRRGEGRYVAV